MNCIAAEKDLEKRFEGIYERGQLPIIKDIEHRVFGSDYGANSWATRAEADDICQLLELRLGHCLLDVGAGKRVSWSTKDQFVTPLQAVW